ncbi:MAG TPA: hypothetical protein VHE30_22855 [Polyangiaceae bacterium]|nr:hypothetical protein [Polyangiaceae bacterium]
MAPSQDFILSYPRRFSDTLLVVGVFLISAAPAICVNAIHRGSQLAWSLMVPAYGVMAAFTWVGRTRVTVAEDGIFIRMRGPFSSPRWVAFREIRTFDHFGERYLLEFHDGTKLLFGPFGPLTRWRHPDTGPAFERLLRASLPKSDAA